MPGRLEVVFAEEVQDKFSASNYGLVDQKSQRLVPMLGVDRTPDPGSGLPYG